MIKWLYQILKPSKGSYVPHWKTKHSIYRAIVNHIEENGDNCHVSSVSLCNKNKKAETTPGFSDALSEPCYNKPSVDEARELALKVKKIAETGSKATENSFYDYIVKHKDIVSLIDPFLEEISNNALAIEPHLFGFANDLAFNSNNKNAVKLGIAILGLCQNQVIIEKLKILGRHDEFTVYVVIALLSLCEDPEDELFELGQHVNGWGKIQLVDRLARISSKEVVRKWLITEGFKNSVNNQYLACTCATGGLLHKKLEGEKISHAYYKSTSEILISMLESGPGEDISCYEHSPELIKSFLDHSLVHAKSIYDFILLHRIKLYLNNQLLEKYKDSGWNDKLITDCLITLDNVIKNGKWKDLVAKALSDIEDDHYENVKEAAKILGL
ncbi:hypothetical protein GCM10007424_11790 [Flavobacterium suaedae]|uniref:HDOD domain-containing protein n=1 Tax=Flavobacterium suaedae TaxID=1767027 RepID=A0ABQ1JPH0_9FLAO|nr:hypothetical protein [Flavobacterium suaedae]GGB73527.1 hypothetical protein GCM10007424_11790 [Flavobacterium suaedae]